MRISPAGVNLIKKFEGFVAKAYKCPAGVWTIGYGHTGPDVTPGLQLTTEQVDALLVRDLLRYEAPVNKLVTVELTQNQFDALVSFVYNVGEGNFSKSTLLKHLNNGDKDKAAAQFLVWNKAGGVELPGLVRRRAAERELFLKGTN